MVCKRESQGEKERQTKRETEKDKMESGRKEGID